MIVEPINDVECLGQLTTFARELAPSTLVHLVAKRLGTREAVILWLQSLPQADDHGDELLRGREHGFDERCGEEGGDNGGGKDGCDREARVSGDF